ncbi:histidinol dehydrogenase, partial [Marinobacter sp. 1Y8]
MRQLSTQDADFDSQLTQLLAFETVNDAELLHTVDDIIAQVRADGNSVVLALTQQFDQHPATSMQELELSKEALAEAFANLDEKVKTALTTAATRVQTFHERQV